MHPGIWTFYLPPPIPLVIEKIRIEAKKRGAASVKGTRVKETLHTTVKFYLSRASIQYNSAF